MASEKASVEMSKSAPIKFSIPALTAEAKLKIREMQLQVLSLRDQARNLLAQSQNVDQQLVAHYNELAQQMEVDTDKFGFDPATLTFHPLQKGA